jgi:chorismate mutase
MTVPITLDTTSADSTSDPIDDLRTRIDAVDAEIIRLWRERASLSGQVGAARIAAGGTRLVLAREQQIVEKFRDALGADGAPLAMLLLRAGRGRL